MSEPAAIILAAGRASRFGSDKLLAEIEREGRSLPLIACTLANWLQAFGRVQVVVLPGSEALQQAVAAALPAACWRINWIVCRDADRGMGVSLAAGVAAVPDVSGWVIGLADMPAVPGAVIAQVRTALLDGAALCAPCCGDRRGHPVGFAAEYRNELLALEGDRGARDLLQRDIDKLQRIETLEPGVLTDVDTPADLLLLNF